MFRALAMTGMAAALATAPAAAPVPAFAQGGQVPGRPDLVDFGNTTVVVETLRGRKALKVLFAQTPRQLQQGLMFRRTLAPWDGMLFNMGAEHRGSFWMRNTVIPLDIIFIRRDGTVDSIGRGKPLSLKPVLSKGPIIGVLELRAGRAVKLGIEPGTVIRHRIFGNAAE